MAHRSKQEIEAALIGKFRQAEFFLKKLEECDRSELKVTCYFSACVSAIRSVPTYVRTALEERNEIRRGGAGNKAWEAKHDELISSSTDEPKAIGEWARQVRNEDVHRAPVELLQSIYGGGGYFHAGYFSPEHWHPGFFPGSAYVQRIEVRNPETGATREPIDACRTGLEYAKALIERFLSEIS